MNKNFDNTIALKIQQTLPIAESAGSHSDSRPVPPFEERTTRPAQRIKNMYGIYTGAGHAKKVLLLFIQRLVSGFFYEPDLISCYC